MTWDEIASVVINPRTGRPISKETLGKHFAPELATGKARLKSAINGKWMAAINAGDQWAVQFGLRHISGFKDNDMTIGVGGGDGSPASSIQVSFVVPKKANGHDTEEE